MESELITQLIQVLKQSLPKEQPTPKQTRTSQHQSQVTIPATMDWNRIIEDDPVDIDDSEDENTQSITLNTVQRQPVVSSPPENTQAPSVDYPKVDSDIYNALAHSKARYSLETPEVFFIIQLLREIRTLNNIVTRLQSNVEYIHHFLNETQSGEKTTDLRLQPLKVSGNKKTSRRKKK